MNIIEQLQKECEYDPEGEGSVDDLIAYKDALEDLVGSLPIESIEAIVSYDYDDEAGDYARRGEPDGHVFEHLQGVDAWLHANVRATR